MISIFLRSLLYNVLFYANLVAWFVVALFPALFLPLPVLLKFARGWARSSDWLLSVICNVRIVVRGRENVPAGPLIIASKHQSFWETFALFEYFEQPLYIYKSELGRIPVFGTLLRAGRMVSVDRKGGARALIAMTKRAGEEVRRGRQLVIFPEGTRRPIGAPPDYKSGIAQIYAEAGVPCLPVALTSGLIWPRRSFLRYPGTLFVQFLEPIPAGLKRRDFMAVLSTRIETATNALVAEARGEQNQPFANGAEGSG